MRFTIPKDATDAEVIALIRQAAAVQKVALVTKHRPGGHDHDQERHGDWAGPGAGEEEPSEGGRDAAPKQEEEQLEGQQTLFDSGPPDDIDESVLYRQRGVEDILSGYRQQPDVAPEQQTLRPSTLDDFQGQTEVKRRLGVMLNSARQRGAQLDHILMAGPPGLGKTTLARILANEMGSNITVVSGTSLTSADDITKLLMSVEEGDVLFIDEIHRIPQRVQEVLYPAMEDFEMDVQLGPQMHRLSIPQFTLIGATTDPGKLLRPFRDRFGHTEQMQYYTPDELELVVSRSAGQLGIGLEPDALSTIADRSRGTPRIANRLLARVRDYAISTGAPSISGQVASEALTAFGVDEYGLDNTDRQILTTLNRFGQPVGLNNLAAVIGEDEETIQNAYEPYLLRAGLVARTPRGRVLTDRGRQYLTEIGGIEKRLNEARRVFAVQKIRKHAAPIHPSGSDQSVHAGKDKKEPKKQYRYTITDLPPSKASAAYEGEVHARGCSHIKRGKAGRAVANVTSFDPEKAAVRYTRTLDQDWGPEKYRVMSCTTNAPEAIQKATDRIAKANFAPTVTVDHTDKNLVFGWANIAFTKDGQQVSDLQGHTIDIDDLEEAAYDFAIRFRKSGGMHKTGPWGDMVESFVATEEKLEALGIPPGTLPQGWWVGFRVPPEEFRKVKDGKWKMFSIQGKAQLEPIDD